MRKFLDEILIVVMCLLILLVLGLAGYNSRPMTEEERAAYESSRTHEYQVTSVCQYIETRTNNFGGIIDQELKYCFTYIGDDGQLHQFNGFEHEESGSWKVCIGDENKYVVKEGFDTYRWLYLTEETLRNMPSK